MRKPNGPIDTFIYSSFVYSGSLVREDRNENYIPLEQKQNSLVKRLHNAKDRHNDIHGTVTLIPKLLELYHGILNVAFGARANHALHDDGVWLVAHFEHVVARDEAEPGPRRLKIINCLPHVALRCKYECRQAIVIIFDLKGSKSRQVAVTERVAGSPSPRHRFLITVEGSRGPTIWRNEGWHTDSVLAR